MTLVRSRPSCISTLTDTRHREQTWYSTPSKYMSLRFDLPGPYSELPQMLHLTWRFPRIHRLSKPEKWLHFQPSDIHGRSNNEYRHPVSSWQVRSRCDSTLPEACRGLQLCIPRSRLSWQPSLGDNDHVYGIRHDQRCRRSYLQAWIYGVVRPQETILNPVWVLLFSTEARFLNFSPL